MPVLESLKAAIRRERQTAQTAYRKLIAAALADREVDEDDAVRILREVGRSLEQFEADVAYFRQDIEWTAQIEAGEAVAPDLKAAARNRQDAMDAAAAAIVKAKADGAAAIETAEREYRQVSLVVEGGKTARLLQSGARRKRENDGEATSL